MIETVVGFCFNIFGMCFTFLSEIEIIGGVTLFDFCLALVVISVVIFGLISTVSTRMLNVVRRENARNMAIQRKVEARAEAEFDRYIRSDRFKHKYSLDDKRRSHSRFYRG